MKGRITRRYLALGCICDSFASSALLSSLLFILVYSTMITDVEACKKCGYKNFQVLQTDCKDQVKALDKATYNKNYSEVCSSLTDVYLCGGEKIPECITNITTFYNAYHQTPYDCHVSNDVIQRLQDFKRGMTCTTEPETQTTVARTTTPNMTSFTVNMSTTSYGRHVNSAHKMSGFSPPILAVISLGCNIILLYIQYFA